MSVSSTNSFGALKFDLDKNRSRLHKILHQLPDFGIKIDKDDNLSKPMERHNTIRKRKSRAKLPPPLVEEGLLAGPDAMP